MELSDMPDIVNFLEAELINFNMDDIAHRTRGQHSEAWNHHGMDNEIMIEHWRDPMTELEQELHDQDLTQE
eukprot:4092078-Heterocapsa_arctica.AAC.1